MELLRRIFATAAATPTRPAYLAPTLSAPVAWASCPCDETGLTYAHLAKLIETFPLPEGLTPGDSVVLRATNSPLFAPMFLGLLFRGIRVLPVSEKLTEAELQFLAVTTSSKATLSTSAPPIAASVSVQPLAFNTENASLLLPTSGTTGRPKVVVRNAASLDAVARNCAESIGFSEFDQVIAAVPLTHSYGIEHGLLAPLWAGCTILLAQGLDLLSLTAALSRRITILPAVPTMIEALADASAPIADLKNAKVYSAGAPLPDAVRQRFAQRYRTHVGQLYGSTEVGSVTYRPGDATSPPNDVGRPMPGVKLEINDAGELSVESPSMFSGYAGSELRPAGPFPTGDLAQLNPHGTLALVGRSSLLVDIGGLKVNPLEVEAVLGDHPEVAECVVVPFRQTETVNRLRAVIVARDACRPPSEQILRSHVQAKLAPHKVPRTFEFRDALPRSAAGKIARSQL